MGYLDGERILFSWLYIGGNINGLGGTSDVMPSQVMSVQDDVCIGSHTLKAQEILLVFQIGNLECLLEGGITMQVTVFFLYGTIIVVEVEWNIIGECPSVEGDFPVVVQ